MYWNTPSRKPTHSARMRPSPNTSERSVRSRANHETPRSPVLSGADVRILLDPVANRVLFILSCLILDSIVNRIPSWATARRRHNLGDEQADVKPGSSQPSWRIFHKGTKHSTDSRHLRALSAIKCTQMLRRLVPTFEEACHCAVGPTSLRSWSRPQRALAQCFSSSILSCSSN